MFDILRPRSRAEGNSRTVGILFFATDAQILNIEILFTNNMLFSYILSVEEI
jgi:hypothetical protein